MESELEHIDDFGGGGGKATGRRAMALWVAAALVVVALLAVVLLRPTSTQAQVEAYVKQMVPLVEKQSGRKFKSIPVVKVVDSDALVSVLASELTPRMSVLEPGGNPSGAASDARAYAATLSKHLIGKYGFETKILYVVPENVKWIKEATGENANSAEVIKLVVAHELTHALQDQYVGLSKLENAAGSLEQAQALNAAVEGQAQFVEERVATSLNLKKTYDQTCRAIGGIGKGSGDTAIDQISSMAGKLASDMYLQGKSFIEWHYAHGGNDQVWRVLSAPPMKSSMILHPETYSPGSSARSLDYDLIVKGMAQELGQINADERIMEVGEMQLQAIYQGMDPDRRSRLLSNLEHAHTAIVSDIPSIANISIMVFKDKSLMKTYLADLEDMARGNVARMNANSMMAIGNLVFAKFSAVKADAASKITFVVDAGSNKYPNIFVRVIRGRVLVEMYAQSLPVSDAEFAKVADIVFSRFPQEMTQ